MDKEFKSILCDNADDFEKKEAHSHIEKAKSEIFKIAHNFNQFESHLGDAEAYLGKGSFSHLENDIKQARTALQNILRDLK